MIDYDKLEKSVDLLKRNLPELSKHLLKGLVEAVETVVEALTPPEGRKVVVVSAPPPEDYRDRVGIECGECPLRDSEFDLCRAGLAEGVPIYSESDPSQVDYHVLKPSEDCPWGRRESQ